MGNQINQESESNPEHSSFYDQADEKFNQSIQNQDKINQGVSKNPEVTTMAESEASDVEAQVRATEDASLQDESYSFDEANTDNEEYHDVDDDYEDFDIDNDDDYVQ